MNMIKNILENSKIMALTDSSGHTCNFIMKAESEKYTVKMYYYLWLSRLFVFTSALSLIIFLAASLALFKLAPDVTVEPFLIVDAQNSSENLIRYEPIASNMASKEKLMETFIRQYVIYRNTIINDEMEMMTRWMPGGMIHFLSNDKIYQDFYPTVEENIRKAGEEQINQEVEILSIGRVGGKNSRVWKVDFKTYTVSQANRNKETGSTPLQVRYWTASIVAYFVPERLFIGRRLINPLGFTVVSYNQTEVQF